MTNHQHLDVMAGELFRVFSRTEYALKAAGFHMGDGRAEANWDKFAIAVEGLVGNALSATYRIHFVAQTHVANNHGATNAATASSLMQRAGI